MALYRGRYIIAVYDKEDFCIGVYDNVSEMCAELGMSENTAYASLYRRKRKYYLVDLYAVEDDVFRETDISTLCQFEEERAANKTVAQVAEDCGISIRSVYRKREVLCELSSKNGY